MDLEKKIQTLKEELRKAESELENNKKPELKEKVMEYLESTEELPMNQELQDTFNNIFEYPECSYDFIDSLFTSLKNKYEDYKKAKDEETNALKELENVISIILRQNPYK